MACGYAGQVRRVHPVATAWDAAENAQTIGQDQVRAFAIGQRDERKMDAPRGFEPRLTESESVVLPLDDGAERGAK